jgi:hypothetical protein
MKPRLVDSIHRMIMESPVFTFTMMDNRPLLKLAIHLTASAFDRIVPLQERTVLYRRYSSNDSLDPFGSTVRCTIFRFLSDTNSRRRRVEHLLRQLAPQAKAVVAGFGNRLSRNDLAAIKATVLLPELSGLTRRWTISRRGKWFGSPLNNSGLFLLM